MSILFPKFKSTAPLQAGLYYARKRTRLMRIAAETPPAPPATPLTWNPLDKSSNTTLSNGNLTATNSSGSDSGVRGTTSRSSGKWYLEFPNVQPSDLRMALLGVATAAQALPAGANDGVGIIGLNGQFGGAGVTSNNGPGNVAGHNAQMAIDITGQKFWYRYDGGAWFGQNSGAADPVAGVNGVTFSLAGALFPCAIFISWDGTAVINIANGIALSAAPPSGFSAWDGN